MMFALLSANAANWDQGRKSKLAAAPTVKGGISGSTLKEREKFEIFLLPTRQLKH